jgi:Holliday junction resolvase
LRLRARRDNNHTDIVGTFRACGFSVLDTANLGNGAPDIFVSKAGETWAIEIKDGSKPPSARKLTKDEEIFRATWQGEYAIIQSVEDVLALIRNR